MKRCLINVEGGLGKNVMLTALMPQLAELYDEIYVISPYVDVFKCCSYVTDAFEPGPKCATLYQELVLNEDTNVLWYEPYSNQRFIKKQCHLLDAWAEGLGLVYTADADFIPHIDVVYEKYPHLKEQVNKVFEDNHINEPIIAQFCGGQSALMPMQDMNGNPVPYRSTEEAIKRNYHEGQKLIDALKEQYPESTIIHYALPNEPSYEGVIKLQLPYIAWVEVTKKAHKIVCTDSSLQHLATGNCNDITVIWGETRPEHFGWHRNKNIAAKHVLNSQPYFKPLGVSPSIVKMPSVEDVMKLVNNEQD